MSQKAFILVSSLLFLLSMITDGVITVNLFTAVFRRPSCLRHPTARHNRLDSSPSQMRRLSLLQMTMSTKSLQKGLPCKALPLQPLLLPRKCPSQSWDTGDISCPCTPFDRLALSGCIVWLIRIENTCVELQGSCEFQCVTMYCGGVVLCSPENVSVGDRPSPRASHGSVEGISLHLGGRLTALGRAVPCMLTCLDAFRIHACYRKHSLSLPACNPPPPPPHPPWHAACIYPDVILVLAIMARIQTHHAFFGNVLFLFPAGKSRN